MSFSRRSLLVGLSSLLASCTTTGKLKLPEAVPAPIPEPWLPCDGRKLPRGLYPELYKVLFGDIPWAETDEHFYLPDMIHPAIGMTYQIKARPSQDSLRVGSVMTFGWGK